MKTKLDLIKEAIEEKNHTKLASLAKALTNDDIIKDLVVKGYLKPSVNCNFCNKLLIEKFANYGTCPNCFKDLASKIVKEGNKKSIKEIIETLKLEQKWTKF